MSSRIDRIGQAILPLVYLLGTMTATIWYFTNGHVSGFYGIEVAGIIMGVSTELHSWLTIRRVVYAYRLRGKGQENDFSTQFRVLVALVLFQVFTGVGFTLSTWHEPFIVSLVKGAAIPTFFLLAGLMGTVYEDIGEMLKRRQYDMARETAQTVIKQHKRRLGKLRKADKNLAPVLVAMLTQEKDSEAAQRIKTIDDVLSLIESESVLQLPSFSSHEDDEIVVEEPSNNHVIPMIPTAWDDLPERARMAWVMYRQHRVPQSQIAERLEVAQSTVSTMIKMVDAYIRGGGKTPVFAIDM